MWTLFIRYPLAMLLAYIPAIKDLMAQQEQVLELDLEGQLLTEIIGEAVVEMPLPPELQGAAAAAALQQWSQRIVRLLLLLQAAQAAVDMVTVQIVVMEVQLGFRQGPILGVAMVHMVTLAVFLKTAAAAAAAAAAPLVVKVAQPTLLHVAVSVPEMADTSEPTVFMVRLLFHQIRLLAIQMRTARLLFNTPQLVVQLLQRKQFVREVFLQR